MCGVWSRKLPGDDLKQQSTEAVHIPRQQASGRRLFVTICRRFALRNHFVPNAHVRYLQAGGGTQRLEHQAVASSKLNTWRAGVLDRSMYLRSAVFR